MSSPESCLPEGPSTPVGPQLPVWQSHKTVRAARIHEVNGNRISLLIPMQNGPDRIAVTTAADKMFARYMPVPGDYYVVYDDDYASISPKKAFEDGYHKL